MGWTQPVCDDCWNKKNAGITPTRVINDSQRCCLCKNPTNGIYMRLNPITVPYPFKEPGEVNG